MASLDSRYGRMAWSKIENEELFIALISHHIIYLHIFHLILLVHGGRQGELCEPNFLPISLVNVVEIVDVIISSARVRMGRCNIHKYEEKGNV